LVLFAIVSYYNRNKSRLESEKFQTSAVSDEKQTGGPMSPGAYAAAMPRAHDQRIKGAPSGYEEYASPPRPVMANDPTPTLKPRTQGDGSKMEGFTSGGGGAGGGSSIDGVMPMDPMDTEQYRPVDFGQTSSSTDYNSCYPSDSQYRVDQLLPKDAANTKWAQVNPAGQGDVKDQQFLTSGYHIGVNTVGTSLRNPTYDIRGEIPNPRVHVSPWNQSTIGPDLNKRVLEGFDQPMACRASGVVAA